MLTPQTSNRNNSRKDLLLVYILPLTIFVLGCLLHYQRGYYHIGLTSVHSQGADDAYISFRYGWNLTHFDNLSWNESGYRRTEGFTNPLWVYISATWAFLGTKGWIYPLMVGTSILISAVLLVLLIHAVYSNNQRSNAAVIGLVLAAATPFIWLHTTSGLESSVFGLGLALLAYLVLFVDDRPQQYIAIFCLATFIGFLRSDGFVYLGIILIAALIAGSKSWKALALGLLVSGMGLILWRQIMFGAWLPNTAVAKVNNFNILDRLPIGYEFLKIVLLDSGILIFLLFGVAALKLEHRRIRLAAGLIIILWLAYYVYIGGDHLFERHLVGIIFFAAALSGSLLSKANHLFRYLFVTVLILGIFISIQRFSDRYNYITPKSNDPRVMLGQALEDDRSHYGVLILAAAGKIPFYAGGDCIDRYGLNDPYLATLQRPQFFPGHSSGNDQVALELAQKHQSGVYSTYSVLDLDLISGPQDISLWVDNRHPQDTVQRQVPQQQWEAAVASGDRFIWSIVSQPVQVSSQSP